jgi:hypothetical protein
MTPRPGAADVRVLAGLKDRFLRKHRQSKAAMNAWAGLVAKRQVLLDDAQWGEPIPKRLRPPELRNFGSLYLIPELPHRFRAIYELAFLALLWIW